MHYRRKRATILNRTKKVEIPWKHIAWGIGFAVGAFVFCFAIYDGSEDRQLMIGLAMITGGIILAAAVMTMIDRMLINHISLRREALKALGKGGLRMIAKDKVARLAYQGIVSFMKNDYLKAEELFQLAFNRSDVRNNQLFCIEWLIKVYQAAENESRLLWCFRKAAELSPDNPEVQSRLGHAYYIHGQLSKAMYCFEQAMKYDPTHGYSYFSKAKILMVRGED